MGFLDKVKNLFTEEIEEEEIKPQKKEVVKPAEPPVMRRETTIPKEVNATPVTESRLEENKEKFVFPVYFDDKDFDDLEKPKAKPALPKEIKKEEPKREPYQGAKVTIAPEPKKVFKPSPIISPVYGVLDKNYSKDDITTKQDKNRVVPRKVKPENMTVDDIRKKAYGTLEDDLEDTLSYDFSSIEEKPRHESANREALDIFNELNFDEIALEKENKFNELEKNIILEKKKVFIDDDTAELARQLEEQKKKLEEISQYMTANEIIKEEKLESDELEFDENEIEELTEEKHVAVDDNEELYDEFEAELEDDFEEETEEEKSLNDSELFDLIDSMYEKKEDDE